MSAFVCPRCGRSSSHPKDAEQGYCGRCHDWTGRPHVDVEVGHLQAREKERARTLAAMLYALQQVPAGVELHVYPDETGLVHLRFWQEQPPPPLARRWCRHLEPTRDVVEGLEPTVAAALQEVLDQGGSFTLVEVGS